MRRLTSDERETVLTRLRAGDTEKEIAADIGVSQQAVSYLAVTRGLRRKGKR